MALTVAPLTATVLGAAPDELAGIASGVNNAVARAAQLLAVAALPVAVGLSRRRLRRPGGVHRRLPDGDADLRGAVRRRAALSRGRPSGTTSCAPDPTWLGRLTAYVDRSGRHMPWRRRRCSSWGGSTSTCCASAPPPVRAADSARLTALPRSSPAGCARPRARGPLRPGVPSREDPRSARPRRPGRAARRRQPGHGLRRHLDHPAARHRHQPGGRLGHRPPRGDRHDAGVRPLALEVRQRRLEGRRQDRRPRRGRRLRRRDRSCPASPPRSPPR